MTNAALRVFSIVYMVARILTGEVPSVPQAAIPVAQVAYNRLNAGWGYAGCFWEWCNECAAAWAQDEAND